MDIVGAIFGIAFWAAIIYAIIKRDSIHDYIRQIPKNSKQKKLVNEVISKIQELAPDFGGAAVWLGSTDQPNCVYFHSLSGKSFTYDFKEHGYTVGGQMAYILASQIAYNFGGECRKIEHAYTESTVGYKVLSQRELAKEREEKRRWDNMTHLS